MVFVGLVVCGFRYRERFIDTEYDRAKVPPYNGHDPPHAPGNLKALMFPPLLNKVQNKGTQGVQARYGAELPPFISIVWYPGRPVILGMEFGRRLPGVRTGRLSCTRLRVPPVALHVSRYTCRS